MGGKPGAAAAAQTAALDDIQEPLAAEWSPSQAVPMFRQRLVPEPERRPCKQTGYPGSLNAGRRRFNWSEERRRQLSGPEVTSRPVTEGPLPKSVITRRVPLQTA